MRIAIILCLILFPISNLFAQEQITVTGTITDESGIPVPGANILEKGTTNGAMTDFDGNYTITVSDNAILQISFIGYGPQTVEVNGQSTIDISMEMETSALDEVVIVGFGKQKKVNLTGAISTVSADDLASRPVANVTQALQGLVPGMNFSYGNNGGKVGSSLNFNIRGVGTLDSNTSSASPLVLIDGVQGDINTLNPDDIENISVLKDAAASSIYGSRAAFGVILITTKRGKSGQMRVSYDNSTRWSSAVNMPKMADSYTYANFLNQIQFNDGQSAQFSPENLQNILDYQNGDISSTTIPDPNTPSIWWWVGNSNNDWLKTIFGGTGFSQEHALSLTGGSEKTQYYLSTSFLDQDGIIKYGNEDMQRYNVNAKINTEIAPWLNTNYSVRFTRKDLDQPTVLNDDVFYYNVMRRWPTQPIYDPNGNLHTELTKQLAIGGNRMSQTDWLVQQLQLEIEPIENWKTFVEINYKTIHSELDEVNNKLPKYNVEGNVYFDPGEKSSIYSNSERTNFFNTNIYSEYTHTFDKHTFKGLLGFQSELNKWRRVAAKKEDLITESLPSINTSTGKEFAYGNANHWATEGIFGRINYNYAERYLFEANLRYDGTSRFGSDKRWNYFPSFSAGWNIAREEFMEPLSGTINTLKLRGSWGELGNQNTVDLYPYIQLMKFYPSSNVNQNNWLVNGSRQNGAAAPDLISSNLGWETMRSWNAGLDLTMLRSRLNFSFDYFVRKTIGMVGPAPELPSALGTPVPRANNADMQSTGFELDLAWRDNINDFKYGVHVLLSDSKQKVLEYPNLSGSFERWREGQQVGEIWGLSTVGIAKSQQEMDAHLASLPNGGQNAIGSAWTEGDIMYADINGDGQITEGNTINDKGDLRIIGTNTPRYNFGLDLDANWKGFDLRIFFQGVAKRDWTFGGGHLVYWGNAGSIWNSAVFTNNLDFYRSADSEWLGANQDARFPRLTGSDKNRRTQTRFVENAAYARLKNIQVGYSLQDLPEKIGLTRLRFYFSAENLFTITDLPKGIEPETLGIGDYGNGSGSYPLTRTLSIGLNANF